MLFSSPHDKLVTLADYLPAFIWTAWSGVRQTVILVPRVISSAIIENNHWTIFMQICGYTYLSIYFTLQPHTHIWRYRHIIFTEQQHKVSNMNVWCRRYVKCVTKRSCGLLCTLREKNNDQRREAQHCIPLSEPSLCVSLPLFSHIDCLNWSWAYSQIESLC